MHRRISERGPREEEIKVAPGCTPSARQIANQRRRGAWKKDLHGFVQGGPGVPEDKDRGQEVEVGEVGMPTLCHSVVHAFAEEGREGWEQCNAAQ